MTDFPQQLIQPAAGAVHTSSAQCLVSDAIQILAGGFSAAGATSTANRGFYIPFMVETPVTAYQMSFEVGAQAGNYDVGLYDEIGNRLTSVGSTVVPAAGLALVNITDTLLTPGVYYMAIVLSTATTLTVNRYNSAAALLISTLGARTQDIGATTLPDPATFAVYTGTFLPGLSVHLAATV